MPVLFAIDPGKTTGWSMFNSADNEFVSGQVAGMFDFYKFLEATLLAPRELMPDDMHVIIEDFIITPETYKKSRQPYSQKIIGVTEWICNARQIPFILQTPREAKAFSTDTKLKKISWWLPNHDHANDAARHMLLYAIKTRVVNPEVFVDADLRL